MEIQYLMHLAQAGLDILTIALCGQMFKHRSHFLHFEISITGSCCIPSFCALIIRIDIFVIFYNLLNYTCSENIISIFFSHLHGRLNFHDITTPVIKIKVMWRFKPTINIHYYFYLFCFIIAKGK